MTGLCCASTNRVYTDWPIFRGPWIAVLRFVVCGCVLLWRSHVSDAVYKLPFQNPLMERVLSMFILYYRNGGITVVDMNMMWSKCWGKCRWYRY